MGYLKFRYNGIGRDTFTVRIIRISGAILSFVTLVLIVQWTIDLYERDIEDLPVILALQDEIRIKPEHLGGKEIDFKGLSVNGVLDESESDYMETSINLAPFDQNLLDNEVNPALIPKEQSDNNLADSITSALESLLGLTNQSEKMDNQNVELHIASYNTPDKANAHWFSLQQVNQDLLVSYNHKVVKLSNSEGDLYRLRILGFESLAAAQDMCSRLIERGERCVPSVGSQ